MKKNENKRMIKIIMALIGLIVIGSILNMKGSAKEEVVEEPKERVCMTWYTLGEDESFADGLITVYDYLKETHEMVRLTDIELDEYVEENIYKISFDFGDHTGKAIIRLHG